MNSKLHVQLAKSLHLKTGVTLSSMLAADPSQFPMIRAVNTLHQDEDIDLQEVSGWLIQTATNARSVTTHGLVYCSYLDALRTALCLEPVYHAYLERSRRRGNAPWSGWVNIVKVPVVSASPDQIAVSANDERQQRVMFFDEWLTTRRDVKDVSNWNDMDVGEHIVGTVYGDRSHEVLIAFDTHTDDHILRYGDAVMCDTDERSVEAVAYKVYLCITNQISDDELVAYFPNPMREGKHA